MTNHSVMLLKKNLQTLSLSLPRNRSNRCLMDLTTREMRSLPSMPGQAGRIVRTGQKCFSECSYVGPNGEDFPRRFWILLQAKKRASSLSRSLLNGEYAYGYLRSEKGVHRLVRLSPFDTAHKRHTSFALVEVIPKISNDNELVIDPNDINIDVFKSSGAGGQNVQ